MEFYDIPLVPGPVTVPEEALAAYNRDYGAADLEPEFFELYDTTQDELRHIVDTENKIAIMTGEGMLALWGALKSCLIPGDRVMAIATGPFGHGISAMAEGITGELRVLAWEPDEIADPAAVEDAIIEYQPKMVTAVHCETPAGTLNPIGEIGALIRKHEVPLFYVDAVSSAAGAPLAIDEWNIDLCLVGTQKCLSCPPDQAIITVSDHAWAAIDEVRYEGYDALAPWQFALEDRFFPYTLSWHATAALHAACQLVLDEGVENVIRRHARVAEMCRDRVWDMGLTLFPQWTIASSPTVTAVRVPDDLDWPSLDAALRERGVVVGGSWGALAGQVFRIGHMGTQADWGLVEAGLDALENVLQALRR
jgi:aspartate aminotransferase-like enzyme